MSSFALLKQRLGALREEHARQDEEDERRASGIRAIERVGGSTAAVAMMGASPRAFDDYDDRLRKGGGSGLTFGQSSSRAAVARLDGLLPAGPSRALALSGGRQSAVIKVVSFASGSTRVGALAAYVTKERDGGIITEDQDALVLDDKALASKLEQWKQGYSSRKASKDVSTIRFDVTGKPDLHRQAVEEGLGRSLDGHQYALRTMVKGEGAFEVMAVVVAEGRTTKDADGKVKRQARYKFDKKFETFIGGKLAAETGAEVEATVTGASHGRDGVVHRLSRLIVDGSAVDDQGREIKTVLDARSLADDWRKTLASRQARDAMHLVMSARSGTDAIAFRKTARELLVSVFAGHEYFFAVHSDRGHLHAHAVILIKGTDGQRIRPDISTFAAWRSRYAEIAKAHGISMVATRRSDTASPPAFNQAEAALCARGVAPEHIRRKVEAKRTNAIHVPVREEGRRRTNEAYQDWKVAETKATTPQAREAISDNLTRLATAVNLSHSSKGRAIARLPIEERGAIMVRATGDYLSAEFNRANQVLNRALPMLEGADKAEATQLANAYLSSLAKQVEAVQAIEAGQIVERAHQIHVREERESIDAAEKAGVLRATAYEAERNLGRDTPPGDTRAMDAQALEVAALRAERTAARERSEADAMSREEQALRYNPIAPAPADPNLPRAGEELREEQELLIDRIETQRMSHTRVHRR
jgi:hypothetical protein